MGRRPGPQVVDCSNQRKHAAFATAAAY